MTTSPVVPQYVSVVVVFAGDDVSAFDLLSVAESVVGSAPDRKGIVSPAGQVCAWDNGLSLTSQQQGPQRYRLETKRQLIQEIEIDPVAAVVRQLVGQTETGDPPVSVGVNAGAVLLETQATLKIMNSLVSPSAPQQLSGRKSAEVTELALRFASRPGSLNIKLRTGDVVTLGALKGLVIDINYHVDVQTEDELSGVLSKESVNKREAEIRRVLRRFVRVAG